MTRLKIDCKQFINIIFFSFALYFTSWFALYKTNINTMPVQSEDTLPSIFLPVTIIKEGTPYANTYYEMLLNKYPHPDDKSFQKGLTPFYLKKIQTESGTNYVSAFTLMPGLMATPVYFFPLVFGMQISWENLIILSHLSSAILIALSGGILYILVSNFFLKSTRKSILITVIYLFGTVNFAMLSQSLWQHGIVELFSLLALLFLYNSQSDLFTKKISSNLSTFLSSLFLGMAILTRPTATLLVPFYYLLLVYFFSDGPDVRKIIKSEGKYKTIQLLFASYFKKLKRLKNIQLSVMYVAKKTLYFVAGFIPPILFFTWYNNTYYKDISNQGYASQFLTSWLSPFPEGFLGMWLSPSKGILVYSPVLIFMFVGFWLSVRNGKWRKNFEYIVFGAIVLLHTLIMSRWKHWYGGYSFGYRMASDVIPFMVLLLVPYVKSELFQKTKRIFYILMAFSVAVQIFGMIFFDGIWHNAYDSGFRDTGWLWSVRDSEAAFNLRRVLVKAGVLERACPQCLPGN